MSSPSRGSAIVVGVLSDTHGHLDPRVVEAFRGVDSIVHAGDVGDRSVIDELSLIAPVTVVAGNMDSARLRAILPRAAEVGFGGVRLYVTHKLEHVPLPLPAGVAIIVTGHTHSPCVVRRDAVVYVDPGSASRPAAGGPTVALIEIRDGSVDARIAEL